MLTSTTTTLSGLVEISKAVYERERTTSVSNITQSKTGDTSDFFIAIKGAETSDSQELLFAVQRNVDLTMNSKIDKTHTKLDISLNTPATGKLTDTHYFKVNMGVNATNSAWDLVFDLANDKKPSMGSWVFVKSGVGGS